MERTTPTVTGQLKDYRSDPEATVAGAKPGADTGPCPVLHLDAYGNADIDVPYAPDRWLLVDDEESMDAVFSATESELAAAPANSVYFGAQDGSVSYLEGDAHRARRSQLSRLLDAAFANFGAERQARLEAARECWERSGRVGLLDEFRSLMVDVALDFVVGVPEGALRDELRWALPRLEDRRVSDSECTDAERTVMRALTTAAASDPDERSVAGRLRRSPLACGDADDVPAELLGLTFTAFTTTASTASWMFLELNAHIECLRTLERLYDDGSLQDQRDYEIACIRETLRLHPVSPLNGVRMALGEGRAGRVHYRPGDILAHNALRAHRGFSLGIDDPGFRPDRWLTGQRPPVNFAPFGGGTRRCIGNRIALRELGEILRTVAPSLRLIYPRPVPAGELQRIFLTPPNDFQVDVEHVGAGKE